MLKNMLKDVATRKAITLLTDSMLGRALVRKLVAQVSKQVGAPLQAQPCDDSLGFWLVTAGAPGADLQLQCRIRTETLAEIIELAAKAWLEDKALDMKELQPILLRALNKSVIPQAPHST